MRHERVYLNDENSDIIAFSLYHQGSSNRMERERMKTILTRAIRRELTDRQRDCITMYYLEGMKMKDIADALHLSRSTVTRHIQSATRKLRRVASYYQR
ncbi:RNA polymerase sigma factor [Ruminococcus sp.]|uniref:RNA polymerase sigma factor n=1 Tax=Ruminococcus sp. TaxID=41978 RepID=UPI00386FF93D